MQGKGGELYGAFRNLPRPLPPPEGFLLLLFTIICVLNCFGGAVYCVVLRVVLCLWVRLIVFGTGYNIVSWVIVSMFLLCFGGLLFWEWVPNTCTGGTAEMTFKEAVEIMDEFVDRMGWLATPAHGTLPDKAAEAVSFLKGQADVPWELLKLEDAVNTGSVSPVLKAFELLKFERLVMFVEHVLLFAPDGSEAKRVAEQLLTYLYQVRDLLNPYYTQEVEHAKDDQ